jgi:hypothetical protein
MQRARDETAGGQLLFHAFICCVTAGCVRSNSSAALLKLACLAMRRKQYKEIAIDNVDASRSIQTIDQTGTLALVMTPRSGNTVKEDRVY